MIQRITVQLISSIVLSHELGMAGGDKQILECWENWVFEWRRDDKATKNKQQAFYTIPKKFKKIEVMRGLKRRWIACNYRCLLTICPFCSVSAFCSSYMPVLKCLMSRLLDTSVLHTEMLGCPISLEYQRQDKFLLHLPPWYVPCGDD